MTRKIFRKRTDVPVVPGPDGARIPKMDCDACGAKNTPVFLVRLADDLGESARCVDFRTCAQRYRMGMSPTAYQRYLRGHEAIFSLAR